MTGDPMWWNGHGWQCFPMPVQTTCAVPMNYQTFNTMTPARISDADLDRIVEKTARRVVELLREAK